MEHRRSARQRVLLTGIVAYADMAISFRCAIRDRSDGGARLRLPPGMTTPDDFWLIDIRAAAAHEARVVWRNYPETGVTLGEPIVLKAPGGELLRLQLRALWLASTA